MKVIWLFLIFTGPARAASLETLALTRLASARDARELSLRQGEFEDLSVALKACAIQRAEGLVPLACYQARRLARAWPENLDGIPAVSELDRLCLSAARALRVDDADIADASAPCRDKIVSARKIRAYRDSDPESGSAPDVWLGN